MKYRQLDQIQALDPGKEIFATRTLRAEEEYLEDHFPRFPVMPGVMMLESLHQAALWVVRSGEDFHHPLALLRQVRNVKFGDFLAPGETLIVHAQCVKTEGNVHTLKANATKGDRVTVTAKMSIELTPTGHNPRLKSDENIRRLVREGFESMFGPLDQIPRSLADT